VLWEILWENLNHQHGRRHHLRKVWIAYDCRFRDELIYLDVPPPPPSERLENLSVSEPSNNPWYPALSDKASSSGRASPLSSPHQQDTGSNVWSSAQSSRPPPIPVPILPAEPNLIDVDDDESGSPAWDEEEEEDDDEEVDEVSHTLQQPLFDSHFESQQISEEKEVWDENAELSRRQKLPGSQYMIEDPAQQGEGWNLVDHESIGQQHSGIVHSNGTTFVQYDNEEVPVLPPRATDEQPPPPPQPPRPSINITHPSDTSVLSPGGNTVRRQKKETYEIKNITWHDVTAAENPRVSPILVQNANGPCPLLALVNALTLSTPASVETALVEALRSREHVSLGLLLDAVFDELMSGRRGDGAHTLPDVSDLYSFLITLHTGMNVNPRFIPAAKSNSPADPRNSMSHVHPADREAATPGTFEDTREMKLYSTFSIPLIHGWLPDRYSPAYEALKRSANSYEDAQNLMFREEELEDKLSRDGVSFEEQGTLEDISIIKTFLATAATQLTHYGLDTITASLAPGAVAILFRNDHFSTLYRHPDTLQLLQLVTDLGYAGHDEVVWESLIDITGENAEFFSGDFRLVGGESASPVQDRHQPLTNNERTTVPITADRHQSISASANSPQRLSGNSPQSPNTIQEDHDLALALQLQEEEEERHRAEIARRNRETELSQQFIEQQGRQGQQNQQSRQQQPNQISRDQRSNSIPVSTRGGRNSSAGLQDVPNGRPAIPPRRSPTTNPTTNSRPVDPEAGVDAPPPTYEEAATEAAYVPPRDHPSHPNSSPSLHSPQGSSPNTQRRPGMGWAGSPTGPSRQRVMPVASSRGQRVQPQPEGKEKDCVVM
jgi:hypothetical protein